MTTEKQSRQSIDVLDPFNLIDIIDKAPYAKNTSQILTDEEYQEAINDLQRVFCCCVSTPEIYMFKDYDSINEIVKVSYTGEAVAKTKLRKIIIGKTFKNEKSKLMTLWDLFIDNQKLFSVKALKFYSTDSQVFSYFRGYDYDLPEDATMEDVKMNVIQPFLDHVREVIANNNEQVYKYILVWIASVLQKPSFKTETALVILGHQGTGKNTFFTNVICKLMARYANENVSSIESVVGKFNAVLENKKLLILNELQSIETNKFLNSDALKSVITDKSIMINQKNEPERLCENVANLILVSNHNNPIKVESTDRCYMITRTSDKHRGDTDYFDKLSASFTPEFYENLFTFFMLYDIKGTNLRKIPETEEKEAIKEASMSSYEIFVRDNYEQIKNITGPDLFNLYNTFVEANKFTPCSSRTLIANIQEFTGKASQKWVEGKNTKVYNLKPEYYEKFKKYHEDLEKQIIEDEIDTDAL